ncbi:hypothetical protein FBY35_5637 [Streptomyces sp. SLBN-118]|nr:hypothetical protein FBY35_5637 [Streptomyces sp. SLBN-118]
MNSCAPRSVRRPADERTRPWWCWTRRVSTLLPGSRLHDRPGPGETGAGPQTALAVDVQGMVIAVTVLAAGTHDNAAGIALLDQVTAHRRHVRKALVDQGFKCEPPYRPAFGATDCASKPVRTSLPPRRVIGA